ncbi:coiled-coil domain-containing protein 138 isoform X2 [Ambystoma mexicanum]|uniref:coiled-coil domain-containing protein 138 isoform X2 n=1 Tax=Ambystoma mexicanum TaxID=8296 RepID=UPI0037E9C4E9
MALRQHTHQYAEGFSKDFCYAPANANLHRPARGDNYLSDALLVKLKGGRSKAQIDGLRKLTNFTESPESPVSSGSILGYCERKGYSKALRELFNLVTNADGNGKEADYHHDFITRQSVEELLQDDDEDGLAADRARDSCTQIYTETDVTLPSYLAANTATLTDQSTKLSPVAMKKKARSPNTDVLREQDFLPSHVNQIYNELLVIHQKLQQESLAQQEFSLRLKKREECLCEKEALLSRHQAALTKIKGVEDEVHAKIRILKEQHEAEIKQLSDMLKEKLKENKRLKASFDTLKDMNDTMKKQLNDVSDQNKKLEIQAKKVQARLENLQRKHAFLTVQKCKDNFSQATQGVKSTKTEKTLAPAKTFKGPFNAHVYELVTLLMDWIADQNLTKLQHEEKDTDKLLDLRASTKQDVQDKCTVLLPLVAEQLQWMPLINSKLHMPFVKFTYWTLRQLESGSQQTPLMSTMRRIGDDLFKGTITRGSQDCSPEPASENRLKSAAFFKNSSLPIRLVSTLIILKTITQGYLKPFLEACSCEAFFRMSAVLLRYPKLDGHILEKLSILLHKLSKIRSNKKQFEIHGIHILIQEMQRTASHDQAFLIINLNSILFNLGFTKTASLSTSP